MITKKSDIKKQRHLLRETTESSQAYETATNMEMGVHNQMRINSTAPLSVNSVQNTRGYCPASCQQQTNTNFTMRFQSNQCRICGQA